jgi:flagellar biogenesis protein FliO
LDSNKHLVLIQVRELESLIAVTGDKIEHLWTEHIDKSPRIDDRHS